MRACLTDFFCYQISGRVNDMCSRILCAMELRENSTIPMMAVKLEGWHYVLSYNPRWVAEASYADVAVTVKHEAYHLILNHIPRYLELKVSLANDKEKTARLKAVHGVACDLAVNSLLVEEEPFLKQHADEWLLPGHGKFARFPRKKSYEWYVRKLMFKR